MNDQQVTAERPFSKAYDRILELLATIDDKVSERYYQSSDSPDWADVGDLNRIVEQLERITEGK